MAIDHAKRGQLINLNKWPAGLEPGQSHAVAITDYMEIARLMLDAGKELPTHAIDHPIIIHCLSGLVELVTPRARQSIGAGQLLYLDANDPHSLNAFEDSEVLLTIIRAA